MWLEEKIICFKYEGDLTKEQEEKILDNIFLKVNENLTNVKLQDLFLKIDEDYPKINQEKKLIKIKGWSILEKVIPITKQFKAHEYDTSTGSVQVKEVDLEICFYDKEIGCIHISEISNPWVQLNDKKFEDEDLKQFEKDIIELSVSKKDNGNSGEGKVLPDSDPSLFINKRYDAGKKDI